MQIIKLTFVRSFHYILLRNCGSYMLYNMNFNWWNTNWALCVDTDVCKASVQVGPVFCSFLSITVQTSALKVIFMKEKE